MINNRLKEFRNKLGLTQNELANNLGKALRTVQNYEQGTRGVDSEILEYLSTNYKLNINWLITGNGDMLLENANTLPQFTQDDFDVPTYLRKEATDNEQSGQAKIENDTLLLPHYTNVSAAAGSGELVYDETSVKQVRISSSIINIQHSSNICIINATGHSMQPMINDGDLLIVDLNHKEYLDEGIYVVRLDNSLLVKHLQKIPNGKCLISENPKFQPITLTADNFNENEASIIGKVLSVIKNFTSSMM